MGSGSAPCHAWIISLDGLKAICPKEVKSCESEIRTFGYNWDDFALAMVKEQFDDLPKHTDPVTMIEAWERLQVAFNKNTTVGKSSLQLGIGHYSSDDGGQYDELEQGCYFTVEDVTRFTPAGAKFRAYIEEKSWTVFG